MENTQQVRYLSTGHLLYVQDGVLTAVPFDPAARELRGPSVPLIQEVRGFSVADDGTLLYTTGNVRLQVGWTQLVWLSRTGEVQPLDPDWTFDRGAGNWGWSLSPDGTRIAVRAEDTDGNMDIWVKDLRRGPQGPLSRITIDPRPEWAPIWSADGEQVIYLSDPGSDGEAWRVSLDRTGEPEFLFAAPGISQHALSPDGTQFVLRYGAFGNSGARDLLTFRPDVDSAPVPLIATPEFQEVDPAISPDGRWLAYVSNETGRPEVYVVSFPDVGTRRIQVSTAGGRTPRWAHSRQESYYTDADRTLVAASYRTEPQFDVIDETPLFTLPEDVLYANLGGIDVVSVTPDDQRFLMGRELAAGGDDPAGESQYVLVLNFFDEVERRVPVP